jgi:NADH-quinone oxidoreductase subunit J
VTSRPRLRLGPHLLRGSVAVGLFLVLGGIVLNANFGAVTGFPADAELTKNLGFALFDLPGAEYRGEAFLTAFEIIDVVLVAALAAAVMLARREIDGEVVTALLAVGPETDDGSDAGVGPTDENGGDA